MQDHESTSTSADTESENHLPFSRRYDKVKDGVKNKKKKLKKSSDNKFVEDDYVVASDVLPWEVQHHLSVTFLKDDLKLDVNTPSIEDLVNEALVFAFPSGIPQYYDRYYTADNPTWDKVVPDMCSDFFHLDKNNEWLKQNFNLNYSCASEEEIFAQEGIIMTGLANMYHSDKHRAAHLAFSMNRMLDEFIQPIEVEKTCNAKKNSEKHEKIKGVIYSILSYFDIPCQLNGASQFQMYYPGIKGRDNRLLIEARPEATICALGNNLKLYPICVVEVCSGVVSDKDKSEDIVSSPSFRDTLADKENKWTEKIESLDDDQLQENKTSSTHVNRSIRTIIPVTCWSDQAFVKIAGQLVIDMYGMLVHQHTCRPLVSCKGYNDSIGLFVMNQYVYLSKLSLDRHHIHILTDGTSKFSTCRRRLLDIEPKVSYPVWGFNLTKPNDRFALLIFLYYFKWIMTAKINKN